MNLSPKARLPEKLSLAEECEDDDYDCGCRRGHQIIGYNFEDENSYPGMCPLCETLATLQSYKSMPAEARALLERFAFEYRGTRGLDGAYSPILSDYRNFLHRKPDTNEPDPDTRTSYVTVKPDTSQNSVATDDITPDTCRDSAVSATGCKPGSTPETSSCKCAGTLVEDVADALGPMFEAMGGTKAAWTNCKNWLGTKHYAALVIGAVADWCDENIESYGSNTMPAHLRSQVE